MAVRMWSVAMSCMLTLIGASASGLEQTVQKMGDSVVDERALVMGEKRYGRRGFGRGINGVSFQQEAVVSHGEYQYVGYYDADRRVCIARRKLPQGAWEVIHFEDYKFKNNDAHNVISIGICPKDGTIHMAFDHHVSALHYRVSRKGAATEADVAWEASLFGPVQAHLEKGKPMQVTYPRFFQTPGGGLQFCWRRRGSGNGDRMLADYDAESGRWQNTRQVDSAQGSYTNFQDKTSKSRCSYPNGYTYGPEGRLHVTWTWREGPGTFNHDLIYVSSTDQGKTWLNDMGDELPGVPRVDSPGLPTIRISGAYGIMNTNAQAVDSQGRIHAILRHCNDESLKQAGSEPGAARFGVPEARRYFHYWRKGPGEWKTVVIPEVAGNRPKLFLDRHDNAVLIFQKQGDLYIMGATGEEEWTDWSVLHKEPGPWFNEMVGDPERWQREGILSILAQKTPPEDTHEPTALHILDFKLK